MEGIGFPRSAKGPLQVLCLGAHCDDIELGCGATILRLRAEQPEAIFHWVVFASTPERAVEARSAAAAFTAADSLQTLSVDSFRESYFPWTGAEIKDRFEGLKAQVQPDLVLTHWRGDGHQDHRTIAELTWNTFRDHLVWEYEIVKYDGDLGRPNVYVPVSEDQARQKVELLLRHFSSQAKRSWFTAETFWAMLRLRGVECNAPSGYAEAFHAHKVVV